MRSGRGGLHSEGLIIRTGEGLLCTCMGELVLDCIGESGWGSSSAVGTQGLKSSQTENASGSLCTEMGQK